MKHGKDLRTVVRSINSLNLFPEKKKERIEFRSDTQKIPKYNEMTVLTKVQKGE